MVRRRDMKKMKWAELDHEGEQQVKPSKSPILLSSDDEANEDLSLKIVQKAMLRACTTGQTDDSLLDESKKGIDGGGVGSMAIIDLSSSAQEEAIVVTSSKDDKKKSKKEKNKNKKTETQDSPVDVAKEEEKAQMGKALENNKLVDTNPVEISDNVVLRKLLRGPRYFDPPDSGWGTCYNCGEEGHTTVNCKSVKRMKPCFVCGSLEHSAKQCIKGQDCFICRSGGHRAKDCPEKYKRGSQSSKTCLKCGDSGHDMFSCKNGYSMDDLKDIQCYICKSFGHLCCASYTDTGPKEVSCYRCGQLGHTGSACTKLHGETTATGSLSSCYRCGEEGHFARECSAISLLMQACTKLHGETTATGSVSSCYRCGEEGHFARECSAKVAKRNRELSTPKRRFSKEDSDYMGVRSVPRDFGKASKRPKTQDEGGFTYTSKSKQRGGWITEDPGDLAHRKAKANRWRSPATPPTNRRNKISNLNSGYASTSRGKLHFGNSASNGSAEFYQHRFSASRFGNSSSNGMRRNYDW